MSDSLLQQVQRLQFTRRSEAEALLLRFLQATFPELDTETVELRPQAVSLNSFNGFLTQASGSRLFFKTHVEQDNVISEYYNAAMLAEAGYPVIQPVFESTRSGQQLLVYEIVTHPSVFDVARQLERAPDAGRLVDLTRAQYLSDDQLFMLYQRTLGDQTAESAAAQPIHQLFFHRLTGGRMERFYGGEQSITVPHGEIPLRALMQARWTINGIDYTPTIADLAQQAVAYLNPAQAGPSVIGHGDAHNGNVFYAGADSPLIYFDPAFAGRHHPLLDLTKPLFHNVFAMWMYFPHEESTALHIETKINGDHWQVTHNYALNPIRRMFLESKVTRTLIPTLRLLKSQENLRGDWRAFLKSALFCCPFLTLDLKQFPPEIALLGLTMAVQMGAEGTADGERSAIDAALDRAADALA
jgi:hypothetical protein